MQKAGFAAAASAAAAAAAAAAVATAACAAGPLRQLSSLLSRNGHRGCHLDMVDAPHGGCAEPGEAQERLEGREGSEHQHVLVVALALPEAVPLAVDDARGDVLVEVQKHAHLWAPATEAPAMEEAKSEDRRRRHEALALGGS